MHPPHVRAEALALVEAGLNDCEISRRLGIPRRTILDWRRPTYRKRLPVATCPRCWRGARPMWFTPEDYAELLGFYLGDGCISDLARTQRLRISLDTKYPGIVESARSLLTRCFPRNPVDTVPYHDGNCLSVSVYSSHLSCVLPQHGLGKKHERPIVLESWQQAIVESEPWAFVRACIWTDGCSFVNRTDVHRPKPYEYLSYGFSNMSKEIVDLFVEACEQVGVFTRVNRSQRGIWDVRMNRRQSVSRLRANVGLKS
ncbi:MAG: helix-turn-helix domain-containing protein [Actinomycetota bacterium]